MLYSSVDNKKIKEFKKLSQKKYRDEANTFLIEGKHLIEEAYMEGYLKELLLEENTNYNLDIETNYATKNVIAYLSELDTPSKMIGVCKKKEEKALGDKILILDEVQDPGNLGTIIRSAKAFNIDTIILGEGCADPYSPKVIRATQGMIFKINIINRKLEKIIKELKENNYKILGTKVSGGKELKTLEKINKFAIIMGSEGHGVKEKYLNLCDEYIYIKMNETCESLNVAVATSIILYWVGD